MGVGGSACLVGHSVQWVVAVVEQPAARQLPACWLLGLRWEGKGSECSCSLWPKDCDNLSERQVTHLFFQLV